MKRKVNLFKETSRYWLDTFVAIVCFTVSCPEVNTALRLKLDT